MSNKTKSGKSICMETGNSTRAENGLTALYCRLAQADSERIVIQEAKLRDYANRHDYGLCAVYRDNGESGISLDRPGLRELIESVQTGNVKRVIVSDISLIARDMILIHRIMDLFSKYEVELISLNDGGLISCVEHSFFMGELIKYARGRYGKPQPSTTTYIMA